MNRVQWLTTCTCFSRVKLTAEDQVAVDSFFQLYICNFYRLFDFTRKRQAFIFMVNNFVDLTLTALGLSAFKLCRAVQAFDMWVFAFSILVQMASNCLSCTMVLQVSNQDTNCHKIDLINLCNSLHFVTISAQCFNMLLEDVNSNYLLHKSIHLLIIKSPIFLVAPSLKICLLTIVSVLSTVGWLWSHNFFQISKIPKPWCVSGDSGQLFDLWSPPPPPPPDQGKF